MVGIQDSRGTEKDSLAVSYKVHLTLEKWKLIVTQKPVHEYLVVLFLETTQMSVSEREISNCALSIQWNALSNKMGRTTDTPNLMTLKGTAPNEMSQSKKFTCWMSPFTPHLQKDKTVRDGEHVSGCQGLASGGRCDWLHENSMKEFWGAKELLCDCVSNKSHVLKPREPYLPSQIYCTVI